MRDHSEIEDLSKSKQFTGPSSDLPMSTGTANAPDDPFNLHDVNDMDDYCTFEFKIVDSRLVILLFTTFRTTICDYINLK